MSILNYFRSNCLFPPWSWVFFCSIQLTLILLYFILLIYLKSNFQNVLNIISGLTFLLNYGLLLFNWFNLFLGMFRDGFLAYTIWCWNLCCVGSALFLPVSFSSKWKKETQIGVPGTSIRCVPTLMGERININTHTCTHTHFIPMKKDFIKDLPVFELSKSPDKTQN